LRRVSSAGILSPLASASNILHNLWQVAHNYYYCSGSAVSTTAHLMTIPDRHSMTGKVAHTPFHRYTARIIFHARVSLFLRTGYAARFIKKFSIEPKKGRNHVVCWTDEETSNIRASFWQKKPQVYLEVEFILPAKCLSIQWLLQIL
jgi:hypothetical protein